LTIYVMANPDLVDLMAHHNHHAFPRSAFHGLRVWEIDQRRDFFQLGVLLRGWLEPSLP
jgi:hypothetical protein